VPPASPSLICPLKSVATDHCCAMLNVLTAAQGKCFQQLTGP
jgi:hypothetical protein